MSRIIIITDLDGTLLNPVTYSCKKAWPVLRQIRKLQIPLIFCSSKTRTEIEVYRKRLKNSHPFISENGGGIFIPAGYFSFPVKARRYRDYDLITLGKSYDEIRKKFSELRKELNVPVDGFGDMSGEKIAALTNLSVKDAILAGQRDFDEPFIFRGHPAPHFLKAINNAGLNWTQGRFFHIMGDHDKGRAVDILKTLYQRAYGKIKIIGLGDSFNDLPMLQRADYPVLIRKENGAYDERIDIPGILKTGSNGDAGWNEAMESLLKTI